MPKSTEKLESKNLNSPEEVRKFDKGKVELVNVAGATIGRATFEPGWKWSEHVGPVATTATHPRCRSPRRRRIRTRSRRMLIGDLLAAS